LDQQTGKRWTCEDATHNCKADSLPKRTSEDKTLMAGPITQLLHKEKTNSNGRRKIPSHIGHSHELTK
jgi:hypothetical protein